MGKKTRLRECPAAGQAITAVECGAGRHTTYACPEQCPFNPFSAANYDQFVALERRAGEKLVHWICGHVPNPAGFDSEMRRVIGSGPNLAYFRSLAWHGIYRLGPEGDTVIGKWAKEGFPGLSSDERVLMRGKQQMRLAMIEVHRVLDAKRVEGVDLLAREGQPFIVVDRGFAAQAVRFGVYMADVVPLPNYWRLFGTCVSFPNVHPLEPLEVIREVIQHLGGGVDPAGWRRWLVEHFDKFHDALTAVALARRRSMFEHLDAQFGKAVYELTGPLDQARQRLDALPQVAQDHLADSEHAEGFIDARVWFARTSDPEYEHVGEGAALGRVLLGRTHWRLEVMGAARLDKMRERFEAWMEDRVRFAGERRDNLGARLRAQEPSYEATLVPPALLRESPRLLTTASRFTATEAHASPEDVTAEFRQQQERRFLDQPIPALEGKTPRQAATVPNLRPKLVHLLKERICQLDQHNLETGRTDDLNWMLRELGLSEILFEPPPLRPRIRSGPDADLNSGGGSLPPPPRLPSRPWTQTEANERLDRALGSFAKMTQALEYLIELDYPLFADLPEVMGDLLERREYQFLFPIISILVLCFAPRGTRPPEISREDLRAAFAREFSQIHGLSAEGLDQRLDTLMEQGPQPALVELGLGLLAVISEQAPPTVRPREASRLIQMIALKVVIDELDGTLRGGQ